jgi:hypothetical protein
MPTNKTLVVGSTGHQHVTAISWEQVGSVNIVDYDRVVLATRPLTSDFLKGQSIGFFEAIRKSLARLLASGGNVIALGEPHIACEVSDYTTHTNYSWSPITVGVQIESGDSISINSARYAKYLKHFHRWDFFYFLPQGCLTSEITKVCGSTSHYTYERSVIPYAENRYNKMLAGAFTFTVHQKDKSDPRALGEIVLLPYIPDLDTREAINLVLEDELQLPQSELFPEWVASISMPLIPNIDAAILEKKNRIRALEDEVTFAENEKADIEKFKKLLFASGHELEDIFSLCLARCGGKIIPAKYSQEEFVLEYRNEHYLVECKGVGKSMALTHVRQLFDYMTKYEEEEGIAGKGILMGNAWRGLPLQARAQTDTPVFPDNVIVRATSLSIALVSSVDFFDAFCKFLKGELAGEAILDRITTTVGVVDFKNHL